jgi:hypothetical protein
MQQMQEAFKRDGVNAHLILDETIPIVDMLFLGPLFLNEG